MTKITCDACGKVILLLRGHKTVEDSGEWQCEVSVSGIGEEKPCRWTFCTGCARTARATIDEMTKPALAAKVDA